MPTGRNDRTAGLLDALAFIDDHVHGAAIWGVIGHCQIGEAAARRRLDTLIEKGLITCETGSNGRPGRQPNAYQTTARGAAIAKHWRQIAALLAGEDAAPAHHLQLVQEPRGGR